MKKYIYPILLFVITFIVYSFTTAPDVMFTDSGELSSAAATLGVSHPTGYPLFTILGFLWSKLPMGVSIILQMNLFSVFWAALSSIIIYLISNLVIENYSLFKIENNNTNIKNSKNSLSKTKENKKLKKNTIITEILVNNENKNVNEVDNVIDSIHSNPTNVNLFSFLISLCFSFSLTLWAQTTSIEVYTLHFFMFSLIYYFILQIYIQYKQNINYINNLYLLSFLIGLSFTNHLSTVLIIPGVLYFYFFILSDTNITAKLKQFPKIVVFLLLGLSVYLYLPINSASDPLFNWGEVSDSFYKFYYHISGKQYQVWLFSDSAVFWSNIGKFFTLLPIQFGIIGLIVILFGLSTLFKMNKSIFLFLIINFFVSLIYVCGYTIHDIDSYFLTPLFPLFIVFIFGVTHYIFISNIPINSTTSNNSKKSNFIIGFLSLILLINFTINYNINNQNDNYLVKDYTMNLTQNLEPKAIIITAQWDYFVSAFWYYQKITGYRTDIVLIEKELLRRTWYYKHLEKWYPKVYNNSKTEIDDFLVELNKFEKNENYNPIMIQTKFITLLNSFIDKNIKNRPVYLTNDVAFGENNEIGKNYTKVPVGFAFKLDNESITNVPNSNTNNNADNNNNNKYYTSKLNLDRTIQYFNQANQSSFNWLFEIFEDKHLENGIRDAQINNLVTLIRYNNYIQSIMERNKALDYLNKLDPNNIELTNYQK